MRDEDIAQTKFAFEAVEELQNDGLDGDVEGGGGFVEDEDAGVGGDGAGDADAGFLAAGELVWQAGEEGLREADHVSEFGDAGVALGFVFEAAEADQGFGDGVCGGVAWVEAAVGVLEDHLDFAALRHGGEFAGAVLADVVAFEEDFAGSGVEQAGDHGGGGRFAAAGFADQT